MRPNTEDRSCKDTETEPWNTGIFLVVTVTSIQNKHW